MYYKGKIVWVTGASSGIGEALVYALNKKGALLVISARRKEELERVKSACDAPENVFVLPIDAEDYDNMSEKVDIVIQHYGRIDIAFLNAGISQRSLAIDTSLNVDKRLMSVNYFGTVALAKAILPFMAKQMSGHFVITGSITGKIAAPLRTSYAASKHALQGFFESLRSEVHMYNIHITILSPGYTRTKVAFNALTAEGNLNKKEDPKINAGMYPEKLAEKILYSVRKKKNELIPGGKEVLGVYLYRFFPALFAKIIRKK